MVLKNGVLKHMSVEDTIILYTSSRTCEGKKFPTAAVLTKSQTLTERESSPTKLLATAKTLGEYILSYIDEAWQVSITKNISLYLKSRMNAYQKYIQFGKRE